MRPQGKAQTQDELARLWADPNHWTPPGIYRCAADPRVIVPKRRPWAGWTINFAHPAAWPVLVLAVLVAVGPPLLLVVLGKVTALRVIFAVAVSLLVLIGGSTWESSRER